MSHYCLSVNGKQRDVPMSETAEMSSVYVVCIAHH